jgi:hypothetical protein
LYEVLFRNSEEKVVEAGQTLLRVVERIFQALMQR